MLNFQKISNNNLYDIKSKYKIANNLEIDKLKFYTNKYKKKFQKIKNYKYYLIKKQYIENIKNYNCEDLSYYIFLIKNKINNLKKKIYKSIFNEQLLYKYYKLYAFKLNHRINNSIVSKSCKNLKSIVFKYNQIYSQNKNSLIKTKILMKNPLVKIRQKIFCKIQNLFNFINREDKLKIINFIKSNFNLKNNIKNINLDNSFVNIELNGLWRYELKNLIKYLLEIESNYNKNTKNISLETVNSDYQSKSKDAIDNIYLNNNISILSDIN